MVDSRRSIIDPKEFKDKPHYVFNKCFVNCNVNKTMVYRDLNLTLVTGSLGIGQGKNIIWEYGDPMFKTVSDFKNVERRKFSAHAWLEDKEGRVYDYCFKEYSIVAQYRKLVLDWKSDTEIKGVSKEILASKGLQYLSAPADLQGELALEWNKTCKVESKSVGSFADKCLQFNCCHPTCTKIGTLRCTGCCILYYCSKDCQKAHWKLAHKAECATLMQQVIKMLSEMSKLSYFSRSSMTSEWPDDPCAFQLTMQHFQQKSPPEIVIEPVHQEIADIINHSVDCAASSTVRLWVPSESKDLRDRIRSDLTLCGPTSTSAADLLRLQIERDIERMMTQHDSVKVMMDDVGMMNPVRIVGHSKRKSKKPKMISVRADRLKKLAVAIGIAK